MGNDDYIPILHTEDLDEAEYIKAILEDHEISVEIEEEEVPEADEDEEEAGYVILVPAEQQEEAEHIIEERADLEVELDEGYDDYDDEEDFYEEEDEEEDEEDDEDPYDLFEDEERF